MDDDWVELGNLMYDGVLEEGCFIHTYSQFIIR